MRRSGWMFPLSRQRPRPESGTTEEELAALQVAVSLYRGDLLEGSYDEWILAERERLRARYVDVLARLTTLLEARGDLAGATRFAEELVRQDSLSEETYRQLMRLYDAAGDRARAIRVYHACAATLERELGVEPSPPTRAAYDALLARRPALQALPVRAAGWLADLHSSGARPSELG